MSCESKLKLSVKTARDARVDIKSDLVEVAVHTDKISWQLEASMSYLTCLYLIVNTSDEIPARDLLFSLEVKIVPGGFVANVENVTATGKNHRKIINNFRSATSSKTCLSQILEKNDFKLEISARLTVRLLDGYLLRVSKVLDDISSPDLADFTIQIEDKTLKVHTYILSARSPVFRRMLANKECDEYKQSLLEIKDVPKDVFEHVLHFLYTGRLPDLPLKEASEVLIVADKYDVQELKEMCDKRMVKLLWPPNTYDHVHDIFQFAHTFNCSQELKMKAFRYVKSNLFKHKTLQDRFVDKPAAVKKLLDKMKEIDEILDESDTEDVRT